MLTEDNSDRADATIDRLLRERPSFHGGGTMRWDATPETLRMIHRFVRPGDSTIETGCGVSTVVFAAAGARHTAISPSPDEHQLISAYCRDHLGDAGSRPTFVEGSSDIVLPGLPSGELFDCVFIDGAHSFPYPVIDFHYLNRHLRIGGVLLLDDVPIPSVRVVYDFLVRSDAWELLEFADFRAAAFRKAAEPPAGDVWRVQPANRSYPDFSFLPPLSRARLTVSARVRARGGRVLARYPRLRRAVGRHRR